ncbi:hypothetical protein [Sulfobacillus thermosulfidooxidans]|uniref:hypothetical protein n=1 Tax=Sulfobacillus thermosulfidooxidans TaxID=28034 RepID=UPI00041981FF|nr:hypothetical protein [Sulfobacillus thermosulfidooxidans]
MNALVVDAEAMAEFLDKAESFISEAEFRHWNEVLITRTQSVMTALYDDVYCWHVVPATARIKAEQHEPWIEREQQMRKAVEHNPNHVVELLVQSQAPAWLWEWATFWLANIYPHDYVWWSRWMYRADSQTGAVALIVSDPSCLKTDSRNLYLSINQAGQFTEQILDGWHRLSLIDTPYRHLVALAMVYTVYLFTMTSWRLTDEFTQVLPPFSKVVASLLGIPRWEGYVVAKSKSH